MLLTTLDRADTTRIKTFDRMVVEMSKYMTEFEIDACVQFINTISDSKWDINPTVDECSSQLRIILGQERYYTIKALWSKDNQHLIERVDNKIKYIRKSDNTVWDGLDESDIESDYIKIRM